MQKENNHLVRSLGVGETWLALLHDKTRGTAQTTSMATIEGEISPDLFLEALRHISQKYPQLCSRIILGEAGYELIQDVTFNTIPVHCLKESHLECWQQTMHDEANLILPQDRYLWRASLISIENQKNPTHHVIITVHHSIYDGLSFVAFLDALLLYFAQPSTDVKPLPVPPPIEKLYVPPTNAGGHPSYLQELDAVEKYRWPHQQSAPIEARETHFKFEFFSNEKIQELKKLSKQHEVSINSMLNAAMLMAAQKIIGQSFHGGLSTPINLRPFTNHQVNKETFSFLCGVINTVHPNISEKTDFWELAKAYETQLKDRFNIFELAQDIGNIDTLTKSLEFLWDPTRHFFCYDFMVTNLGLLQFDHASASYHVRAVRFGTCRHAGDNNMMLLLDSTDAGMFLTFGYCHPLILDSWAEQFIKHFKTILGFIS